MKSNNSDDNLMSMEKFESNPQPSFDVADHPNPDLNFQSEFSEQSQSTNEATNENAASVVPIG